MALLARFDPAAPMPAPITAWYDLARFAYPELPPASELAEVPLDLWNRRMHGRLRVQSGRVIEVGEDA